MAVLALAVAMLTGCGSRSMAMVTIETFATADGPVHQYDFIKERFHHTMSVAPPPYAIVTDKQSGKTARMTITAALDQLREEIEPAVKSLPNRPEPRDDLLTIPPLR